MSTDAIPTNSRIAIYGTGLRGRDFADHLAKARKDVDVVCFVDSFRKGNLGDKPIHRVDGFCRNPEGVDHVLIASYQWKDIAENLARCDFDRWALASRPEYAGKSVDCVYSNALGFLLILTPKCAARSLRNALMVASDEGRSFDLHQEQRSLNDPHFTSFFKFAFVRNPWDRVVSFYTEKFNDPDPSSVHYEQHCRQWKVILGVEHIDFELYLSSIVSMDDVFIDRHCCPQSVILSEMGVNQCVEFIGRFERLADDFGTVCKKLGIQASLPHYGASDRNSNYQAYYTETTQQFVEQRFSRDVELFNYTY